MAGSASSKVSKLRRSRRLFFAGPRTSVSISWYAALATWVKARRLVLDEELDVSVLDGSPSRR